jgi:predicted MPP superfamily phosphohydrolase
MTEMTDKPAPRGNIVRRRKITRRGFLRTALGTTLLGAGAYAYGATRGVHQLVVEHVAVPMPGLAARWHNRRIVHLSDFHAGRTSIGHIRNALDLAASLKPEVLAITGDFIDHARVDHGPLCEALRKVTAHIETIGITGNHDFSHNFVDLTCVNALCSALLGAGVRMLRNGVHQPRAGPGELCFAGVEDYWSGAMRADTLRLAPPESRVIVLSHNPDSYEDLDAHRFDLMLSGHTHGGQVCVPFFGPLILPVRKRERYAGLYHLSPKFPDRALYITRGVGHILQVRLFCPPEVTCITLKNPAMA